MRFRRPVSFAALLLFLAPTTALSLTHIAREGETLTQLAVRYYGSEKKTMILRAANGFVHPDDGTLTQGEQVEVPEPIFHRIEDGDTWNDLADRFLASKKRGRFLSKINDSEKNKMPPLGTIIKIPYHLRHILATEESLKSVTRLYYRKTRTTRWLRQYNLTRKKRFARGDVLIIPLVDLELTEEEKARLEKKETTRYTGEDISGQKKAVKEIVEVKKAYENGLYVEMVAMAGRLVGRGKLTVPQQIGVHNYLGYAYVALGEKKLAIQAFITALKLQPTMELSSITTSPKILDVFNEARKAAFATPGKQDTPPLNKKEKK
ncbi:MAG: hypothetical protein GY854_01975 [Deltaproteobacteria bacterium]|nr:hypothetical protein [Deltaproteobacteria bacterium]